MENERIPPDRTPPGRLVEGETRRYTEGDQIVTVERWNGQDYYTRTGGLSGDVESTLNNFQFTEASFSTGMVTFSADEDAVLIKDDSGKNRCILGRIATGAYGLQVNNASETEVFGIYGGFANLAGWQINTDSINKTYGGVTVSLNTTSGQPKYTITKSSVTTLKVGMLDGSSAGIEIKNNAGNQTLMRVDNASSQIAQIGGWVFTSDKFMSTSSGARIELDSSLSRIAIYEGSGATKVAMGYLAGLQKNNSVGFEISSTIGGSGNAPIVTIPIISSDEHTNAFKPSTLNALEYWVAKANGDLYSSQTSPFLVTANTYNTISLSGVNAMTIITAGYAADYDCFVLKFANDDYGFWALQGEQMRIDGDVTYDSGDWLINSDAALKFFTGEGKEVMRVGTVSGKKGLFIGDDIANASPSILAEYTGSQILIGNYAGNQYMKYTPAGGLEIKGTVTVESSPEFEVIWQESFTGDTNVGGTYSNVGNYLSNNYLINPVATIEGGAAANTTTHQIIVASSEATMGNMVFRSGDNSGNDESWIVSKSFIPFDADTTYRMTCRIRDTGTTSGTVYIGWQMYDVNKDPIRSDGGSNLLYSGQFYFVASGSDIGTDWIIKEGFVRGVGSPTGNNSGGTTSLTDLGVVHSSTKYIAPLLITQYQDDSGQHEVDYMIVEALSGGLHSHRTIIDGGKITTGKIQSSDEKTYFDLDNDKILMTQGSTPRVVIGNTDGSGDYALKVSSLSHNVTTATDDELMFSSNWAIPKYTVLFGGNETNTTGSGLLDSYYSTWISGVCNVNNNAGTSMQDTSENWEINQFTGSSIVRTNAGLNDDVSMQATAIITSNTANVITHEALQGGYPTSGNDWDNGDTYQIIPKFWGRFGQGDGYYVGTRKQTSGYSGTNWMTSSEGTTIALFPYLHDRNNKYLRLSAFLAARTSLRLGIYRYTWNDHTTAKKLQLELAGMVDKGRFFYDSMANGSGSGSPSSNALSKGDAIWTNDPSSGTGFVEPAWYVCTDSAYQASDFASIAEMQVGLNQGNLDTHFAPIYDQFPFVRIYNTNAPSGHYKVTTLDLESHLTASQKLKHGDLYIIRLTGGRTTATQYANTGSHLILQPQVSVHGYDFNAINDSNSS